MTRAAVALGANLGDRQATLAAAVDAVAALPGVTVVAVSGTYASAPVGGPPDQPSFLNGVLVLDTSLDPQDLLAALHRVENDHGRVREVRWGPRTLDLDLLAYDDLACDGPNLTLPHPRAHQRAFVLVPWAEVDPRFEVAGLGTVEKLLAALPPAQRASVQPV